MNESYPGRGEVPPIDEQLGEIMGEARERIHNEQLVLREAELTVDLTNDPGVGALQDVKGVVGKFRIFEGDAVEQAAGIINAEETRIVADGLLEAILKMPLPLVFSVPKLPKSLLQFKRDPSRGMFDRLKEDRRTRVSRFLSNPGNTKDEA
jgi:hypothetical protein